MMFRGLLPWVLGLVLVAVLAAPFGQDLYHRYQFNRELAQLSDPAAREALKQRYGSLAAFGDDLARHCQAIYGDADPNCRRYRLSLRD